MYLNVIDIFKIKSKTNSAGFLQPGRICGKSYISDNYGMSIYYNCLSICRYCRFNLEIFGLIMRQRSPSKRPSDGKTAVKKTARNPATKIAKVTAPNWGGFFMHIKTTCPRRKNKKISSISKRHKKARVLFTHGPAVFSLSLSWPVSNANNNRAQRNQYKPV